MPRRALLVLLACAASASSARAAPIATPIVFVGDAAPGLAGETFASSFNADVNDAGQVAINGRGSTSGQGIWTWDLATGGPATPVLLPGASPVGPAGAEIARAFGREITPSGGIGVEGTFRTGVAGVTSSNQTFLGSWSLADGHTMVARTGDPAPGLPGYTMFWTAASSIADWNGAGEMVQSIGAFAPPFTLSGGLYRHDSGSGLATLVLPGDPVPGDPGRVVVGTGALHAINEAGDIAFAGSTGTALGDPGDATLFGPDGAGGFRELIRDGGAAPGLPAGATVRSLPGGGDFSLNAQGAVAFAANLDVGPGGVTGGDDSAVWVASPAGDIVLRHREGDAIPGSPGLAYGAFDDVPLLNAAGELAHSGKLALGVGGVTTSDDAVLLVPDGAGGLAIAARERDANPLLDGEEWGVFNVLAFGDAGGLVFFATERSTAAPRVYYRDPGGALTLLVGQGLDLDLGGGDVRTVATLVDFRASEGAVHLVASAQFTDGTRGLVLLAVPEPEAGVLVAFGIALLALRARRRRGLSDGVA